MSVGVNNQTKINPNGTFGFLYIGFESRIWVAKTKNTNTLYFLGFFYFGYMYVWEIRVYWESETLSLVLYKGIGKRLYSRADISGFIWNFVWIRQTSNYVNLSSSFCWFSLWRSLFVVVNIFYLFVVPQQ